mgnify:CR=1 FL=1
MLFKANNTTEISMTVWYSLILIINLTPNVGITPNANFQSHIIQNNLSKNECMRQAYELKKDPRFYIKNNGEVLENFQNSDEVLATTGTIAIQLAPIDTYSFFLN